MSSWARFWANVGAIFWAKKILLNCLPGLQPQLGQLQGGEVQLAEHAAPVQREAGLDQVEDPEDI